MIRWLHISDLHLGSCDMSTDMLRNELPDFLAKEGLKCDYVFCTGDIKTAGPHDNGYTEDMATYMLDICQAVGVKSERLFVVPGNHDINRDIDARKQAIKKVKFQRQGYYDPAKGVIDESDYTDIMCGEQQFAFFLAKIFDQEKAALYANAKRPHFAIETPDFNILHVDTTIAYTEGQEATDLIVGTYALSQEIKTLNKNKPTILLTHYPFTALLQDEKKYLSYILQKNEIRLWLAGHEHDHLVQSVGYINQLQAGELRLEDKSNATFLIGEYDPFSYKGKIKAYSWFPEGWAKYPFLDLDNKSKDCFDFELRPFQKDNLSVEAKATKDANKPYYQRLPNKVENNLLPFIDDGGNIIAFKDLLENTWDGDAQHIILLADGGMGKTTMFLDYCRSTTDAILYIPVERLAALHIGIEEYCIAKVYDNDKQKFQERLRTRYSVPTLTLFIDGLNEVDGNAERSFVLEIQRLNLLKGLRIVVSSRSNFTVRYSMPGYRSTKLRPLDDNQIQIYFNEKEWETIKGTRALHHLLSNPMMVTVYKEICSVIEEFENLEFLDWILPVKNSTDLFHNYYVAQLALTMKRSVTDGEKMLLAKICISEILPAIAYDYECKHRLNYDNKEFRILLNDILNKRTVDESNLLSIQEYFRQIELPELTVVKVIDFITNEMRLLCRDNLVTVFPHQIYRDYLSAQWIVTQSSKGNILDFWNGRVIPQPVMTHIRLCSGDYWRNGIACYVHSAGMDMKDDSSHFLVENLFSCFPRTDSSGTPDYSRLWLKGHRLPDNPIGDKKICLKDAEIDMATIGLSSENVVLYSNLCLSEDGSYFAAVAIQEYMHQIQINIFSVSNGEKVYYHTLNKSVDNMLFHHNRLFVVAAGIYVFTLDNEKQWHFTGMIGDREKKMTKKLKMAIIAKNILYLYYFSRLETFDLNNNCQRIDIINDKGWENPIKGDDVSSLKETVPWVTKHLRQNDILSEAQNNFLKVVSYGDGGLVIQSEGESQMEISKGAVLLMDAAISGDGKRAATLGFRTAGENRKIQFWDLDRENRLDDYSCPSVVNNIHLSENGKWIMGETDSDTWVLNSEDGKVMLYHEHFVSNHMGKLVTYGNKVVRKHGNSLYFFDLDNANEELLNSPADSPNMVCFLPDGTIASTDRNGKALYLWSTRDGKILSQYMDGYDILSIQPINSKPFIAVFTSDQKIRIYHTGVRTQYGTMQCLIKEAGETNAKQMVAHQSIPLMACTDSRRYLETRFFSEWTSHGKEKGLWKKYRYSGGKGLIDGDILDIAFNPLNQKLVAILANGKIVYCSDKYCEYQDSFKIITSFNVDAYDFKDCICSESVQIALRRNGAL